MLNENKLRLLFPRAKKDIIAAFLAEEGALFDHFGLNENLTRLHFFLAQIGHESSGLTILSEDLNYSAERLYVVWPSHFADLQAATPFAGKPEKLADMVYANRMGNGDADTGDGWRYRGRGYIQITGKDSYENVGGIADLDLVKGPDLASDPKQALRVACAFWSWKKLNALCDMGDFVEVTKRINGGTAGLANRRTWLDKVYQVLGKGPGEVTAVDTSTIIAVQRALHNSGFPEIGTADGIMGVRTASAITRYRQEQGLPPGQIDDALLNKLGIAVA